jgi:predicted  nucleic acid-binding Zn-ribbon protein
MMSTRRPPSLIFTAPLVLEPPRHCGLSSIALVPGRHLIGSAEDCGIRLELEGVLDRHALILVGESRTIVKAIDPRTWINDGPVTEMALRAGDRLSIGPLTFRVRSASPEEYAAFPPPEPQATVEPAPPPAPVRRPEPVRPVVPPAPVLTAPPVPKVETVVEAVRNTDRLEPAESAKPGVSTEVPAPAPVARRVEPSPPAADDKLDTAKLDSKLDEIQQRLADLKQVASVVTQSVAPAPVPSAIDSELAQRRQQIEAKEMELRLRTEQLTTEQKRLAERIERVAAAETQLEAQQKQLAAEAQRISDAAESARAGLAQEHARHAAVWQEWEATYTRLTGELATQLESIDRQQKTLNLDAERLSAGRVDMDRVRLELEQHRREFSAESARLDEERARLTELQSRFEDERRRSQAEFQNRAVQADADRQELQRQQAEISASLSQLQQQRQAFLTEWTEMSRSVQEERTHLTDERQRLDDQLAQVTRGQRELADARDELARLRSEFEQDRARGQLLSQADVQQWQDRSRTAELELLQLRQELDSLRTEIASKRVEPTFHEPVATAPATTLPGAAHFPEAGIAMDWNAMSSIESDFARFSTDFPTALTAPGFDGSAASNLPYRTGDSGSNPIFPAAAARDLASDVSWSVPHPSESAMASSSLHAASAVDPWGDFVPSALRFPESRLVAPVESRPGHFEEPVSSLANEDVTAGCVGVAPETTVATTLAEVPRLTESIADDLAADATLAVVNREFGSPVVEAPKAASTGLPSWWLDGSTGKHDEAPVESPASVPLDAHQAPTEVTSSTAEPDNAVNDLRSKLAMLFDLPADSESSAPRHDAATEADPVAEVSEQVTETPPPAERSDDRPAVGEVASTSDSRVEDSVEEFMARLLERSRNSGDHYPAVVLPKTPRQESSEQAVSPSLEPQVQPNLETDRSHLLAEPKHKQDRQAVRENLQSFRQVAHLSARSALAKHSLQQLRNAAIAKGVLFGVTVSATLWFLSEPLRGSAIQWWKCVACALGAILAAVEFRRSWNQLRKPLEIPESLAPEATDADTSVEVGPVEAAPPSADALTTSQPAD